MDLSRVSYIREASNEDLKNADFLEHLILKLGFNNEIMHEQPYIVHQHVGGLKLWQYPNQFSKYMAKILAVYPIQSYIEIGCRWGGTFVTTIEYLNKVQNTTYVRGVAVDIMQSPVIQYCNMNPHTSFLCMDSRSDEFKAYIHDNFFDMIFIDGDHSYDGVKNDYEATKNNGKIFVFHDIHSPGVCSGVVRFWQELKANESANYEFFEFIDQYEEVVSSMNTTYLGIGVAVKRN